MLALAEQGAPEGSWLRAGRQTGGRGRMGRHWESPAGNLHSSTLVRVRASDPPAHTLALVAANAVHALIAPLCVGNARIKWPNDIELDGRKVAGVLCESEATGTLVVGIGVNVRRAEEDFDHSLQDRAISLVSAGYFVERGELARALFSELRLVLDPLPEVLDGGLRRELECRDKLIGRMVNTDVGLEGRAMGISSDGALILEVDGIFRTVRTGSVWLNSARSKKQT